MLPYLLGSIFSPLLGLYIDKLPNRAFYIMLSCFVFLLTHLSAMLITCDDACYLAILPVALLGFCVSLYSTILIPTITLVVPPKLIGTAFGLIGIW